jgi:PAS domain S-box-containing protein
MLNQTHWLVPALTAALAATLLLSLVYYYLYTRYRRKYLGVWACAWSIYCFRFVAELLGILNSLSSNTAAVAIQSVTLFSGFLLLCGTYSYLSKPMPRAWIAVYAVGIFWKPLTSILGFDFVGLTAPIFIVITAAYAWTGTVILKSAGTRATGKHLAGWAFIVWSGLHPACLLFAGTYRCREWGFLAEAVLGTCVAIGFLLMYFEDSRAELARSAESLRQLVQNMPVMLVARDEKNIYSAWNRECERVSGYSAAEIIGNPRAFETLYPDPEQRARLLAEIESSRFNYRGMEWDLACKNGETRTISWFNISGAFPIPGWYTWAVGVDITERRHAEQEMRTRALQQEAVAGLGQHALVGADLNELFNEAVRSTGRILQVEYCEVLELIPGEDKLVMRATLPGIEDLIGQAVIDAGKGSQAGYTLERREPVVMPDIQTETRFAPNYLMREHGIVSGMSVVIEGRKHSFGVLNASAKHSRRFTEGDINFLKSSANVLAAAIERKQAEAALHHSEQEAKRLAAEETVMAEIGRIISSKLNIGEVYERFAATVKQVLPFDRISINIADPTAGRLVIRYATGGPVPGRDPGDEMPLAGMATAEVIRSRASLLVQPESLEALVRQHPGHQPAYLAGYCSSLFAPLVSEGRAFGALVLMSRSPGRYGPHEIALAESVAGQISGAIAHAHLLNEHIRAEASLRASELAAQRLAREKAVMAEIGRILGSTLTIEDVYGRFSEEVRKIISFDRITINRILPEKASVQILYTAGPMVPEHRPDTEYPLAGTITEKIVLSKKGIAYAPDTEDELARSFPTILPMWKAGFRSFLLVPLISRDNVIGTLVLSSYRAGNYAPDDVTLANSIASQISGAIANARLFAERERMADALRESEASLRSIFRVAPIGIGVVHNRVLSQVNDRICEMLGYAAEELEGRSARVLYPTDEDFEFVGREKYLQIRARGTGTVETRWQRKDGEAIDVLLSSTPLDPSDWSMGVTFTALDITASKHGEQERLRLEDRLRQAQKMEAIGTLAGGIAHDFNNILAAIIGFAELAKIEAQGNGEVTANLAEVLKASFRARDLVRQILTFSRQTETEFGPIQIQLIVKEALKLLRASLPSTIQVRQDLASEGLVLGDPTQIHQVVMNLCTNAFHAMHERGGVLEVGLSETQIGASPPPDLRVLPQGPCLKMRVRDSGPGIDPSIIHRIFDPYFSTKEKGKGTGLGLAVVHGIVKSHRGAIQVSSRLGEGATFDVYFPMVQAAAAMAEANSEAAVVGGRERILFVDDEPTIEFLGRQMLGSLGYEVATCGTAIAALELFRSDPSAFDLVITDMTMPLMTGDRMALEMMGLRPDLPVIICTGFNELLTKEHAQELGIREILMKPFLKNEAATLIRQVLDQR